MREGTLDMSVLGPLQESEIAKYKDRMRVVRERMHAEEQNARVRNVSTAVHVPTASANMIPGLTLHNDITQLTDTTL